MKNISNERTIALNEILRELYCEEMKKKDKDIVTIQDSIYKNFVNDNTQKLKDIFKALKFDIEKYKNKNGRYEIPIVVAEVFKVYLTEDSIKGSFISKIKGKNFLEITIDEKKNFINKVIERLKERFEEYPNAEEEINDIHMRWMGEAEYNEKVKTKIIETGYISNLLIEAAIINVGSISEIDGLVSVNNFKVDYIEEDKYADYFKKISDTKVPYNIRLSEDDRLELIDYLRTTIIESINTWKDIVNIACDIREENVSEYDMDSSDFISSDKLVKMSIEEYEKKIEANMTRKQVPKYSKQEFEEILKSIKQNMENN